MKIPQDKRLTRYALDEASSLYTKNEKQGDVLVYLVRHAVSRPDHPKYRQVKGTLKQAAKDLKMTQKELKGYLDDLEFWNYYFVSTGDNLGELRLLPHPTHFTGDTGYFDRSYRDLVEYAKKKYPSIISPEGQTP